MRQVEVVRDPSATCPCNYVVVSQLPHPKSGHCSKRGSLGHVQGIYCQAVLRQLKVSDDSDSHWICFLLGPVSCCGRLVRNLHVFLRSSIGHVFSFYQRVLLRVASVASGREDVFQGFRYRFPVRVYCRPVNASSFFRSVHAGGQFTHDVLRRSKCFFLSKAKLLIHFFFGGVGLVIFCFGDCLHSYRRFERYFVRANVFRLGEGFTVRVSRLVTRCRPRSYLYFCEERCFFCLLVVGVREGFL